jgi:hypothetical protein
MESDILKSVYFRDLERPHLRQDDLAVAVHLQHVLGIDPAPHGQRERIAGPDHIVGSDGDIGHGGERAHRLAEDIVPELLEFRGDVGGDLAGKQPFHDGRLLLHHGRLPSGLAGTIRLRDQRIGIRLLFDLPLSGFQEVLNLPSRDRAITGDRLLRDTCAS